MNTNDEHRDERWVVFQGPCLPREDAEAILPDAHFQPPIRRGDLPRLLAEGWSRFAIIDGEFSQSLSVSLVEIREAVHAGAWICGSSSMGALRASESQPLGMNGVGWIYEAYVSGRIESDEEVALVFDTERHRAMSVPMVNLRWAGERAVASGVLGAAQVDAALRCAADVPYWERTFDFLRQAPATSSNAALSTLVSAMEQDPRAHDRKALDAVELLTRIAERRIVRRAPAGPPTMQYVPAEPPSVEQFLGRPGEQPKTPGSHRISSPEAALERAWIDARRVGVTRLADLSDLERLGLSSYSSLRPYADVGDITVTGGKGLSADGARVGALLEAVERACLSCRNRPVVYGTLAEVAREHRVLHPNALVRELDCTWSESEPLPWWPARDLLTGEAMMVPAASVFFPVPEGPRLFPSSSAGAATGATLTEALLYGLIEVIERDIATYAWWFRDGRPLDLSTITDEHSRHVIETLQSAGIDVHCWVVYNEFSLPLFSVALDDRNEDNTLYVNAGQACHLDPRVAFASALSEAVYTRLTVVSGSREDLERDKAARAGMDIQTVRQHALQWSSTEPVDFRQLPDLSTRTITGDLQRALEVCKGGGLERVLAVDLSLDDGRFHVVRCIVPGYEAGLCATHVGPRLLGWLRDKADRRVPVPVQDHA
ncbi:MAG: YcaO-like family protein [Myxococcota bacterium]